MNKRRMSALIVFVFFVAIFSFMGTAFAASHLEIAEYWAPQVYQDVNDTYGVRADFITNFNYDGDWAGNNNWDNLNNYAQNAYVYYKVQETDTHYFIEYDFFHARDDGPIILDAHENDLEGCIVVIRKGGGTYGSFQLMETMAHNQWYSYTNDPAITSGSDNVDGGVLFNGSHPKVFIQSNGMSPGGGHGVYAYDGSGAPGGDGIVYNYTGSAQYPSDATGNYTNQYGYALKSIDELWNRRNDTGGSGHTFETFGVFDGDDNMDDSAKGPWLWDDSDDGPTYAGMNFSDPAHMVDTHLNGLGTFSHNYVYNPYYTYKATVSTLTSNANRDPLGGKSDIYVKLSFGGEALGEMDRLWKFDNAAVGSAKTVRWGYDTAIFHGQYSSDYSTLYLSHKPAYSQVVISVMDSDDGDDDEMGNIYSNPTPGKTITYTNAATDKNEAFVTATVSANAE